MSLNEWNEWRLKTDQQRRLIRDAFRNPYADGLPHQPQTAADHTVGPQKRGAGWKFAAALAAGLVAYVAGKKGPSTS